MRYSKNAIYFLCKMFAGVLFSAVATTAIAQVLPSEVTNYRARAAESKYLPQLEALQQEIGLASFPFPFQLARYVNARSGRAVMDRDGIEFVNFQHRIVLKVSGVYKVAFDASLRSENQRVARTLEGVGIPLLRMAAKAVPADDDYDGIGLEIVYDTHDSNSAYSFEGKEALSVVFSRADAVAFADATSDDARQEILNRSDLYVSGKPFGVALGQRNPIDPGSSDDRATRGPAANADSAVLIRASAALRAASSGNAPVAPPRADVAESAAKHHEADVLLAKVEPPTTTMVKDVDGAKLGLEHEVSPSLEKSGNQVLMRVSLQNSIAFNGANTSIYKRAAQSFDLFLAPEMRALLKTLPTDAKFDAFEFAVVNQVANGVATSETVDYIIPVDSTRAFVENRLTSQDLINQSIVLVNGVRIGLNLAAVE